MDEKLNTGCQNKVFFYEIGDTWEIRDPSILCYFRQDKDISHTNLEFKYLFDLPMEHI